MILQNGLTLAYIGDAYYELAVRKYLIEKKLTKVNDLHKNAIKFTSANNQAKACKVLLEEVFTEEEIKIYKRGRNQTSTHKPKNSNIATYNMSTGFEAVIGYHYLDSNEKRLNELISKTIDILEISQE